MGNFTTSMFNDIKTPEYATSNLGNFSFGSEALQKAGFDGSGVTGDASSTVGSGLFGSLGGTFKNALKGFTGSIDPKTAIKSEGWGSGLLALGQAGLDFYQGKQQNDLAKDMLATNIEQFNKQYDTQKHLINMDIYDKGKRMYNGNTQGNLTPEEYYNKNKLA